MISRLVQNMQTVLRIILRSKNINKVYAFRLLKEDEKRGKSNKTHSSNGVFLMACFYTLLMLTISLWVREFFVNWDIIFTKSDTKAVNEFLSKIRHELTWNFGYKIVDFVIDNQKKAY